MIDQRGRDRIAKALALLASPIAGEVVAAARALQRLLARHGLRPEDLVDGIWASDPEDETPPANEPPDDDPVVAPEPPPTAPPPRPWSARDFGPAGLRRVISELLEEELFAKDVVFLRELSARLYHEPHKDVSTSEVRRINALWRARRAATPHAEAA